MPDIQNQLLLWAVGPWADNHLQNLLAALRERGCESHDLRISQLQNGFAAQLIVSGNWSSVGKLETALPQLQEKLGLKLGAERVSERATRKEMRPFAIELSAPQNGDLLPALVDFFLQHGAVVAEVVSQPYAAHQTEATMINMQMVVLVRTDAQPPALRESFMDFCDDFNADGIFDPIKS